MNKFRGWKTVFSFNYKQNAGSKSYIAVTVLGAVAILALCIILSLVAAKPDDGEIEQEFCDVETVLVLDLVGLGELDFEKSIPELKDPYYMGLELIQVTDMTEEELSAEAARYSEYAVGVVIKQEEGSLNVTAVIPSTSDTDISLTDGQKIAELLVSCVEDARFAQSGINAFQAAQIRKQTVIAVSDAGEEANVVVTLVKYFAPAIFGLVLYFLLLLYGQNLNQGVSVEKTSKLIETLLTSLHPYALLTGKVFAVVAVALQQFFIWVAALVIGLMAGGFAAEKMYPGAEGGIGVVVEFLRANIGETALSPAAVVLAVVTFCCGFLFYCVLSGMAGSMVSRPEEAANTQSIFTLPIVISWLICYFAALMEKEAILVVARNIPFTIPFCVPVDLLTGAIGIGQGVVSTVILLIFSILIIMLSGRIYKGLVLYTGEKITFKNIVGILKNKN